MPETGKLVRDRIPEIVESHGETPVTRVLSPSERLPALLAKLREETAELEAAADPDHQAEELADIYEVVLALATELGLPWSEVERLAAAKRTERGGFTEGIWLQGTAAD